MLTSFPLSKMEANFVSLFYGKRNDFSTSERSHHSKTTWVSTGRGRA